MQINYVIATYAGKGTKVHIEPKEKALKLHCHRLTQFKNSLKSITIMRANDEKTENNDVYEGYYDIEEYTKIITPTPCIVDCENYCYSFGQWLLCYEQTKEEYDYYIFQEDDYIPNVDNFDTIYIDAYKKQFPEDIGVMCGMLLGIPNRLQHLALHVSAPIVVSSKTLKMLYTSELWNGNPRNAMQNMLNYQKNFTPKEAKSFRKFKQGIGAYYQLGFSLLFNKLDIPSDDILAQSDDNAFLYWDDKSKKVYLYSSKQKAIPLNFETYTALKPRAYFLPFQWEL